MKYDDKYWYLIRHRFLWFWERDNHWYIIQCCFLWFWERDNHWYIIQCCFVIVRTWQPLIHNTILFFVILRTWQPLIHYTMLFFVILRTWQPLIHYTMLFCDCENMSYRITSSETTFLTSVSSSLFLLTPFLRCLQERTSSPTSPVSLEVSLPSSCTTMVARASSTPSARSYRRATGARGRSPSTKTLFLWQPSSPVSWWRRDSRRTY